MNLISVIFTAILISYSLDVTAKSVKTNHVDDVYEKLNLSGDPHDTKHEGSKHHDYDDKHDKHDKHDEHNPHESPSSYETHSSESYHDDPHDHYYEPEEEGEIERNVVKNCREFINKKAKSPSACIFRPRKKEFNSYVSSQDLFDKTSYKIGRCRWDHEYQVCYCPRSQEMCYDKKLKEKCYWHEEPKYTYDYDGYKVEEDSHGECISNAERFYNILHKLLIKRGKKDFAIRLNYNSIPARSELPYGPHGPSVINYGTSSNRHSALNKYFTLADHSGEGAYTPYGGISSSPASYLTPYGQSYESNVGYGNTATQNPYGYGSAPQGIYDDGNPAHGNIQYGYGTEQQYTNYGSKPNNYEYSTYETQPVYDQVYGNSPQYGSYQNLNSYPSTNTYQSPNIYQTGESSPSYGSTVYGTSPQPEYNQSPQSEYNQSPQHEYNLSPQPEYNQVPHQSYDFSAPQELYGGSTSQQHYSTQSYESAYGNQNNYNNQMPSIQYENRQPPSFSNSPLPQTNHGQQSTQYFAPY